MSLPKLFNYFQYILHFNLKKLIGSKCMRETHTTQGNRNEALKVGVCYDFPQMVQQATQPSLLSLSLCTCCSSSLIIFPQISSLIFDFKLTRSYLHLCIRLESSLPKVILKILPIFCVVSFSFTKVIDQVDIFILLKENFVFEHFGKCKFLEKY